MSRASRRFLKIAGIAYLAGLGLFLYASYAAVALVERPRLVSTRLTIPQRDHFSGWRSQERFERAKREIAEAGYLMRAAQAGLEAYQPVGARELETLVQAGVRAVLVWDPRSCREFAARSLRAAEDLHDAAGNIVARAGDLLDEERLVRMALAFDAEKGDRARDRILVTGTGRLFVLDMTPIFVGLNFLALAAILHASLWDPVLRLLDERARAIREDIEAARKAREEAEALRAVRPARRPEAPSAGSADGAGAEKGANG